MINNEQVIANDIVKVYEYPSAGKIRQSKLAASFSATNKDEILSAPSHGQDTHSVLLDVGFTESEISNFRSNSVIKTS